MCLNDRMDLLPVLVLPVEDAKEGGSDYHGDDLLLGKCRKGVSIGERREGKREGGSVRGR
jgi:hypothetical protein